MTDTEIYAARPDIKAANDLYVALGAKLTELKPQQTAAHAAVQDTEAAAREVVRVATKARDEAQANLEAVAAAEQGKLNAAKRAAQKIDAESARVTNERAEAQREHNEAVADFEKEQAAAKKLAAAKAETEVNDTPTE